MQRTGIGILLLALNLHLTAAWITVSINSPFDIDFDHYDLEMKVSGVREIDIHSNYAFDGHIEFTIDSSSSTFYIAMPCGSDRISNVPVPASNERDWRMTKTSIGLSLYCDEILVGYFSKSSSSLNCLSPDQWNNFGRGLMFVDSAVTHYQLVSTSEL